MSLLSNREKRRVIDPRRWASADAIGKSDFRATLFAAFCPVCFFFRPGKPSRGQQQNHIEELSDHEGRTPHRQGQKDRATEQQSRTRGYDRRSQHADYKEENVHHLLSIVLDHSKSKTQGVLARRTYKKVSKHKEFFQSILSDSAVFEPFTADPIRFCRLKHVPAIDLRNDTTGLSRLSGQIIDGACR